MPNISLQELIFLFKIVIYFAGIIGAIIMLGFGVISYFFKSDRKQNTDEHGKLFEKTDEHSTEITELKTEMKNIKKDHDRNHG